MQYSNQICVLWLSQTAQKLFVHQKAHTPWQRPETLNYYDQSDILRITASNFCPEPQDLAGINLPFPVVTNMRIDGMEFEIHDIGGLPPLRRRQYAHCFDDSDIFMFAAALSHYDQPVTSLVNNSDATPANRLAAAMEEFAYFLNRKVPSLRRHQPILMLTEKDVFTAKMQHSSLSEQSQFADFQGNSWDGVEYITKKFKYYVPDKDWDVVHVAEGQNQCSLQFLLDAARNILMIEVSNDETAKIPTGSKLSHTSLVVNQNLRRSGFFHPPSLDFKESYDSD
jgi:hypothetical protein